MNYYERHIGDYLKDTAHLSLLHHGVYARLMDVYYTREHGFAEGEAHRLIGARTKEERTATEEVLAEFFVCIDGTQWAQGRCDAEIARFRDKQVKAKRSADARWSASERNANASNRADANDMRTHSEGNAPRARPQTPDTKHQSPDPGEENTRTAPLTDAGRVCLALKRTGLSGLNPGHPDLLALIAAGASEAEFIGAAQAAVDRGKGFAYAIGMLKRQREDAAKASKSMHTGPLPGAPPARQSATDRQIATMNALTGKDRDHDRQGAPAADTIDIAARIVP